MKGISTKTNIIILAITLLSFSIIGGAVGRWSSNKIAFNYSRIEEINLPDTRTLLEAYVHFRSMRMYLLQLCLPGQKLKDRDVLKEKIHGEEEHYDKLMKAYTKDPLEPDEKNLYVPVEEKMKIYKLDLEKALILLEKADAKESMEMDAARKIANDDMKIHSADYKEVLNKLLDWQSNEAKRSGEIARQSKTSGLNWMIAVNVLSLILGGFLTTYILRNILAAEKMAEKTLIESIRSSSMVDNSPVSTMMCDASGKLIYMNASSKDNLKKLQKHLSVNVDNLLGQPIDIFHKNPAAIKKIISDPKNLPHRAIISIGDEKLDVLITASVDSYGNYLGVALSWTMATAKDALINDLTKASANLALAASNVLSISTNLSSAAEETSAQANTASVASEQVKSGVHNVASNMKEMSDAIREITKTTNEAASMSTDAMTKAQNTNLIINKLGESSIDIGNVIKVISSIAQQTNLLALNATIEAARAGEAGKGFAVVANEVKELANQTAKATQEITKKIETIQLDSKNAVDAIAEISIAIEKVSGHTGNIAASVEQQAATTHEISRIVAESAKGVQQINENIGQVSEAASNTEKDAMNAQNAAKSVGDIAELLHEYVGRLAV